MTRVYPSYTSGRLLGTLSSTRKRNLEYYASANYEVNDTAESATDVQISVTMFSRLFPEGVMKTATIPTVIVQGEDTLGTTFYFDLDVGDVIYKQHVKLELYVSTSTEVRIYRSNRYYTEEFEATALDVNSMQELADGVATIKTRVDTQRARLLSIVEKFEDTAVPSMGMSDLIDFLSTPHSLIEGSVVKADKVIPFYSCTKQSETTTPIPYEHSTVGNGVGNSYQSAAYTQQFNAKVFLKTAYLPHKGSMVLYSMETGAVLTTITPPTTTSEFYGYGVTRDYVYIHEYDAGSKIRVFNNSGVLVTTLVPLNHVGYGGYYWTQANSIRVGYDSNQLFIRMPWSSTSTYSPQNQVLIEFRGTGFYTSAKIDNIHTTAGTTDTSVFADPSYWGIIGDHWVFSTGFFKSAAGYPTYPTLFYTTRGVLSHRSSTKIELEQIKGSGLSTLTNGDGSYYVVSTTEDNSEVLLNRYSNSHALIETFATGAHYAYVEQVMMSADSRYVYTSIWNDDYNIVKDVYVSERAKPMNSANFVRIPKGQDIRSHHPDGYFPSLVVVDPSSNYFSVWYSNKAEVKMKAVRYLRSGTLDHYIINP